MCEKKEQKQNHHKYRIIEFIQGRISCKISSLYKNQITMDRMSQTS